MGPPIQTKVLLNVDLGEGYGNFKGGPDDELIPLIDYANVACGGHAGDPIIMQDTVRKCKEHGVKVGAHPGLPDLQGFGRREMKMQPEEITALVRYQVGALTAFLRAEGMELSHIKAHGSLYGMTYRDPNLCRAFLLGAQTFAVPVFGLPGTLQETLAHEFDVPFIAEIYGDVKYNDDLTLVIDRVKKPWTNEDLESHIRNQIESQTVRSVSGAVVEKPVGEGRVTLCCHSDSPGAVEIVKLARGVLHGFNGGN